ncbi:hypothetical protein KR093_007873, partial [Drosophila rubida]
KLEPSGTTEKCDIKERLNLHVKRRLKQEISEALHNDSGLIATINKRCRVNPMPAKDIQKLRKPYQKRVDRIKTETNNKGKKVPSAVPSADLELFDEPIEHEAESIESKNLNRDRFKNADMLNIVLSTKKRALMNNPEVQLFWSKIMSAPNN